VLGHDWRARRRQTTIVKAILRILAAKDTGLLPCALMGV